MKGSRAIYLYVYFVAQDLDVIGIKMIDINILLQEAISQHQEGNLEVAKLLYCKILKAEPEDVETLLLLAQLNLQQGDNDTAIKLLKEVIALKPDSAEAYNSLADVFREQGEFNKAIEYFESAIRFKPDYADVYYNLGITYYEEGLLEEAVVNYKEAIRLNPGHIKAYNNLGVALTRQGNTEDAMSCFKWAIKLDPGYAEAHFNLGNMLWGQGLLEDAISSYSLTLEFDPDHSEARWNRSLALLLIGRYDKAWPDYEVRFIRKDPPPRSFTQPRWDGSPLAGRTIYIYAEQGFGDTFQFVRFLPLVKHRGGYVIFECQQDLRALLRRCAGFDEIVEKQVDGEAAAQFDLHLPLLSLPGILGITLDNLMADVPYIHPDSDLVTEWQDRLIYKISNRINPQSLIPDHQSAIRNPFKVGIVWAGRSTYKYDKERSCSLADFAPLTNIPGVILFGLQKGDGAVQAVNPHSGMSIINLGEELDNSGGRFVDTAAVIANLDLVISIDTAVVHLAGAIGKRVWTLLPFSNDWRWLLRREDSPWYPTMRLFRQPRPGDWQSVIHAVVDELRKEKDRGEG